MYLAHSRLCDSVLYKLVFDIDIDTVSWNAEADLWSLV